MNTPNKSDQELEDRLASRFLDVLIRAGLILAMIMLCFQIFSPFLTLMAWAMILAINLYPLHRSLAAKLGGKQGLSATLIVGISIVLLAWPTAVLMSSLGDSIQQLVSDVKSNSLQIPAPRPSVAEWPLVGKKLHGLWSSAHADLPALIQSMQPKIGDLAKGALGFVASIGGGLLQFVASLIIAGIMMAFGEGGARSMQAISERFVGPERGGEFTKLSTATIRAVAQGVIGVAFIQAVIVGLVLLVAGIPWAGVLALIVLVLGIAQVPAVIVTLPAIGYLWSGGDYSTAMAAVLHRRLARVGHGGQCSEALDARSRRRCADAGHSSRRTGRHGDCRHPRDVRRRHAAGARLPDLHELGGDQSGRPEDSFRSRLAVVQLNRRSACR